YYLKESIIAPLFKLLEVLFELTVPFIVASIIDSGIALQDKAFILSRTFLLAVLGAVGLISAITAQYFAAKAAVGVATALRWDLFSKIQSFSYSRLDEIGSSTLITRMTSDINQVQSGLNLTLRLVLRSPFIVFGALAAAFFIDKKSALIFAVSIPLLAVIIFAIMLITIPIYSKVQTALDRVLLKLRENLSGTRVIRAFCKEQEQIEEFNGGLSSLNRLQIFAGRISALMNPLTFVIINFAVIILINTGATGVNEGALSQGEVVALYNYMAQILVELIKLASLIITLTKSTASAKRIDNILKIKDDMKDGEKEITKAVNSISFENVSFKYEGACENAVDNISFKAEKGSIIGIIGPTGCGKTTLINLIPRFYDVTSGSIKINGTDIKEYRTDDLRHLIGVVPQKSVLFKGSIRDNLKWGNDNADDKALLTALEGAEAKEFVLQKQGGLDFEIEQGGKNLSGGQRQRLAIARALVRKPQILILDDSSSSLDYATERNLKKALKNLDFSPTVFIVSKRASSVQFADSILVLEDGKATGFASSDELLKTNEVYREIYNSQLKTEEAI
ncbi:MAG: ABC transporter ATP-binding protein, partial [Clostridia bacterium]|nr:ABC transporter ATP-binding protein [Clostridia bacterium]